MDFYADFSLRDIIQVTLVLFSVIDILGAIPVIIDLRRRTGSLEAGKATIVAGFIMVAFLFFGTNVLTLFGVDVQSFAIAGAIIIFLIGLEMILGKHVFAPEVDSRTSSIVPLAFPIIAGAGTMTTIISLRAEYRIVNILVGILLNLVVVYLVLRSSVFLERKLGTGGANILRKVFGIVLLAISIKLLKAQIHFPR
jgi:multiple antibiotic resistance protein